MRLLTAFIFDRRYSVPTLLVAEMVAVGQEEAYAERLLSKSDHYYAVELRDDDELVTRVARDLDRHVRTMSRGSGMSA